MTFSGAQLDEILTDIRAVADQAGALLLAGLDQPKQISHKGTVDLVTEYDRRSEAFIRDTLSARFPEIGMLAEEDGASGPTGAQARWIVDPLDGTTNYAHGHPWFAVSIGLEESGRLVAGAVTVPAMQISSWARREGGAFCNGASVRVSSTARLSSSLVATGFPYDRRTAHDDNTREHRAFVKRTQGVRRLGSAAADLVLVARGTCDGFWEPRLHAWDLAAGVVLVREAGGTVTDFDGAPIDIHRGWIVASNGRIQRQMIETIEQTRKTL